MKSFPIAIGSRTCQVKYRDYGRGDVTVVLVHGFGNSSLMWLPFTLPFSRSYRFLAIDLPGYGESRGLPSPGEDPIGIYADCIRELVRRETTNARKVFLAGYSLGAYSCLRLQKETGLDAFAGYLHVEHTPMPAPRDGWDGAIHPELFECFVRLVDYVERDSVSVECSARELPPEALDAYVKVLASIARRSLADRPLRLLSNAVHDWSLTRPLVLSRGDWAWVYPTIRRYRYGTDDLRDAAMNLRVPVTVVSGERSELFDAGARRFFAEKVPGAILHTFARSGHEAPFREPVRFARVLAEFLRSRPENTDS